MPADYGGLGAQVLLVDTEHSFRSERLLEIARSVIDQIDANYADNRTFDQRHVLDNMILKICKEPNELVALILYHLRQYLIDHRRVRWINVNGFTSFFYGKFD